MQVPVTIPDLFFGLKEAVGFLKAGKNAIELELQEQDTLAGAIKSDIRTYSVGFGQIDSILFNKKLFGAQIIIKGSSLEAMKDIPGANRAEIHFKVDKKNKKEAENLVSHLRLQLSEYRLTQMDEDETTV